jgi:hypothetical protein
MVNRMLRDHLPYAKIVEAVQALDYQVTERNISNWKTRGGYAEWRLQQERALQTRLLQDNITEHLRTSDASRLPEVGLQLAATHLSQFFLQPDAPQQLMDDPANFTRAAAVLCRIAGQIQVLQKYRDDAIKEIDPDLDPERVRRQSLEETEDIRRILSAPTPPEESSDEVIQPRNYFPKQQ